MKSKTSFFNRGVAKNLLRRFWPLWAGYLFLLLLSFVFPLRENLTESLANMNSYLRDYRVEMAQFILSDGKVQVFLGCVAAVLAAMAMFSYLYNARSCGMMNSLPIRRETMFSTAFLVGLLPLLLCQVIAVLLAVLLTLGKGIALRYFLQWLAMAAMGVTAFYGMAVFCAMLTGNILVLPAVFLVLNLTAYVVEMCLIGILRWLLFGGVNHMNARFEWLSPIVKIAADLQVESLYGETGPAYDVVVKGMGILGAYCAAGLLLAFFALLLYRKRRMESATDVVAISILKPVFKYCMAVGTALVLPNVVIDMLNPNIKGTPVFILILLMLLLGAFLGYFIAEMLLQKTVKVFGSHWKGLLITMAALLLFAAAAELDVTGYERRVPAMDQIESIKFCDVEIRETDNIELVRTLHSQIIEHKSRYEKDLNWDGTDFILFRYVLKDGRELTRSYDLYFNRSDTLNEESDLSLLEKLENSREVVLKKATARLEMDESTLRYASLDYNYPTGSDEYGGEYANAQLRLTAAQAMDLYYNCLLPDAAEGHMVHYTIFDSRPGQEASNVTFSFSLAKDFDVTRYKPYDPADMDDRWFVIYKDSARCLQWLEENTDIEVLFDTQENSYAAIPYGAVG